MYIKFCRSYDGDKKDEVRANLSPESKLSVELEGEKGTSEHFLLMPLSFTDLSITWLSFPLGKQVDRKTRLYQALCMFLAVLCLILLVVIIVLSKRGAYLLPWCRFLLKTNHCCTIMFVTLKWTMKGWWFFHSCVREVYISAWQCFYSIFAYNRNHDRNRTHIRFLCCSQQPLFLSLTAPPTLFWILEQTGSTVCPEIGSQDSRKAEGCNIDKCRNLWPIAEHPREFVAQHINKL